MNDPKLDSYWEAVRDERYQPHLRYLPGRLERASRRREARRVSPRLAWALGAVLLVVGAGFISVEHAETSGYLIAGRTETLLASETMAALEALPLPAVHNLSVSSDSAGTSFALFVQRDAREPLGVWTARVEASARPTELRVQSIEVVTDRTLWAGLLDRFGVTLQASGSTRAEIQAQIDAQLAAIGSGHARVEQHTSPNGENSVRIIVKDIE